MPDPFDSGLLVNTQKYLASQLERLVPDTLLSQAWDRFYQIYSSAIRGFVRRFEITQTDADDIAQEVWAEVITRLPAFHWNANRSGLRHWFYKLVKSKTMDVFRRQKRARAKSLASPEIAQDADRRCTRDPGKCWRREFLQAILNDLRDSNPKSVAIVQMQYFDGHKSTEVAKMLGLRLSSVRYRRKRMLKKLRRRARFFAGQDTEVGTD
jgi:RNA polymerase sigma-70 factor (ECF subfamily)